ncbi:MAG: hypothetical protein IH855_13000 [Bacteroidetes bacterium]|nr:hypothetical protein [Bacteroidota bacterium]
MRIVKALLVIGFILAVSLPACNCDEGYITSPDADVTSTDDAPVEPAE